MLRLTGTSVTRGDSLCSPHCKVKNFSKKVSFSFFLTKPVTGVATFGASTHGPPAQVAAGGAGNEHGGFPEDLYPGPGLSEIMSHV